MSFPSGNFNSDGKKLCSITCWHFPLLIWEWIFQTIWSEVATGDLPSRLMHAINTLTIWMFSVTSTFWIISKRSIHSSWLLWKLTNKITQQTTLISHSSHSGGKLSTRLYDKRDDFYFLTVNFPFLSSNIPSGSSYGVYILQFIKYARCCSHCNDFRYRHKCLVDRLQSQSYIALRL